MSMIDSKTAVTYEMLLLNHPLASNLNQDMENIFTRFEDETENSPDI